MSSWLLLRIPRTEGAAELSGVLASDEGRLSARGPTPRAVIDALLAGAPPATLILPLDGRHALALEVQDEAERRGWAFARHVPPGEEAQLLDLEGPDANPARPNAASCAIAEAVRAAFEADALAEALDLLRGGLALGVRRWGWWDPDTLWALSNLTRVAIATADPTNLQEARGFGALLLAQPDPLTSRNPAGTLRKLRELAMNQTRAGEDVEPTLRRAIAVAGALRGPGHEDQLALLNDLGHYLSAREDPRASEVFRDLILLADERQRADKAAGVST